jgi:hypothetical protein
MKLAILVEAAEVVIREWDAVQAGAGQGNNWLEIYFEQLQNTFDRLFPHGCTVSSNRDEPDTLREWKAVVAFIYRPPTDTSVQALRLATAALRRLELVPETISETESTFGPGGGAYSLGGKTPSADGYVPNYRLWPIGLKRSDYLKKVWSQYEILHPGSLPEAPTTKRKSGRPEDDPERNKRILEMAKKLKPGQIAKQLKTSRDAVRGVLKRAEGRK